MTFGYVQAHTRIRAVCCCSALFFIFYGYCCFVRSTMHTCLIRFNVRLIVAYVHVEYVQSDRKRRENIFSKCDRVVYYCYIIIIAIINVIVTGSISINIIQIYAFIDECDHHRHTPKFHHLWLISFSFGSIIVVISARNGVEFE